LLLQALVLVLGALALARPVGTAPVPRGTIVAVVVDTSLSMSTGGVGEPPSASPLAQARRYVATRASNLPPGGQLLVVAAGRSPELLAPLSSDRVVLARAAEALRVTCPKADLNAALHATLERLRDAPSGSEIVVLTDGAHDEPLNTRGVSLPVSVQLLARDADRPNTAILSADARTRHDAGSADRAEVFVRVAHFGPAPREVFVTVSALVAGEQASDETPILASERVLIAPGEPANLVRAAELPPDRSGRAPFVRVAVAGAEEGGGDALAADDVVVLPSPAARRLPVFMVGSVPESVQRVFRTDPELELFATTLERLAQRESGEPPLDGLMVFGGRVPDEVPPGGALVLFPEGEEVFGLPLGERVASTQVTRWDETDPLLRFVPLADVTLADVRTLPSSVRPLVHTQLGAVVGILPGAQGDVVFVSVDPDRGGWSRTPGFVIFFRNILERARERRAAGGVPAGEVGEALRVVAAQGERVRVEAPDGSVREVEGTAGVALVPVPPLAGAFQVAVGWATRREAA
jgi:hypothetical protein